MADKNSEVARVFQGRPTPVPGRPVGYAALVGRHGLRVPLPPRLAIIADRHQRLELEDWLVLTPRHAPKDTLAGHLEFALKWEGVDLGVLAKLFQEIPSDDVRTVVLATPTGAYARRLWFLYEWLTGRTLDIPDASRIRAIPVLDPGMQYGIARGTTSARHNVINNLPGTVEFCPLVRKTPTLESFQQQRLDEKARTLIGRTHPAILARAAAFLLLSDSRSSFSIEGERPSPDRAIRWGNAISEAGRAPLSIEELERLQRIVIGDARFVTLGLRKEGGFVGDHDRITGQPLPEHISAKPEDLGPLLNGVVAYSERTHSRRMDPVIVAAAVAFGFVYIHPFEDGNGRLHRWLIHHALGIAGYNPPGVVFPVSAAILRNIESYQAVLESYSKPLLKLIDWKATDKGNVQVYNQTLEYYRYFDATPHAEFLYYAVRETINMDLPNEVAYIEAYEQFRDRVNAVVDMPDKTIDLLHRFLRQGSGVLSKRAREKEFADLAEEEVIQIEDAFARTIGTVPGAIGGGSTVTEDAMLAGFSPERDQS
ncbi:MAG: Fic family protein [Gemmatimonadaceae bacterium]